MAKTSTHTTSEDTKTIVTVLLLIFMYPVGVIVMWFWTNWPIWVKVLISVLFFLFFILIFLGIFSAIILTAINPAGQLEKARLKQQQMQQQVQYMMSPTPTTQY